jgi:nicotinate-nucleotide adenylyltransferase
VSPASPGVRASRRGACGVFGGAFDPPHVAHVELARAGIARFGLERLLVRVVAEPGHKEVVTPAADRLRLAEAAFAELPEAEVALDPFPRTVDSLRALGLDDPVFLIGADEFASFLSWKEPDGVLALARLGVATRPGYPPRALVAVLGRLVHPERVEIFEIPELPIASTAIRALVAEGGPVEGLVPPAVLREIEGLGLYREGASR